MIIDAVKKLVTKFGGTPANNDDIADNLDCLCACALGSDWNASEGEAGYVKNRTHYEAVETVSEPLNITWDGNTEGLVCVADMLYKVSDAVLTDEQIKSATVGVSDGTTLTISALWDEAVMITDELVAPCEYVLFVRKEGAEFNGITFSECGIYFSNLEGLYTSSLTTTEPVEQTKTVVHKLDKKYLPDDVSGGEQYIRINGDTITDEFWCNMSFEAVCNLCFNEHRLPVMGVLSGEYSTYCYLADVVDNTGALPTGYVKLLFINPINTADEISLYYKVDGVITSIMPGGK